MSTHPLWSHSLPERLGMLKKGTIRVAYLAPKPEYGTFRYRCFNPVHAINRHSTQLSASYFFYSDLVTLENLADYVDVLVVSRCPHDAPLDRLYRRFRNQGKKVLFDIDDLVFDTRYATLVASNLGYLLEGEELNQWTAFISNIGTALRASDGVITTNPYLAERISDVTPLPVFVAPNTFNEAQREVSNAALAVTKPQHKGLHLGYFSGSPSHSLDFAVVASQLSSFLQESRDSTLTIVGYLEIPAELAHVEKQITTEPFMDFLSMQSLLRGIDLNIVPLQDSPFTWSKSELKYFEAALVETPTLASATPVFQDAIRHGVTGYLAGSTQWLEKLRHIETQGPEALAAIGQQAKASVMTSYSPEALADKLDGILGKQK
jgi:glycosyltransferase involved in cell wall biosynthesis